MLNKYLNAPKSFGLLGKTLKHSYSKTIHENFGYSYELFELDEKELGTFINSRHFLGLNVTIPYKETVLKFCDKIDDTAKNIGAANTLYFDKFGKLHAANTDYFGFLNALKISEISLENKTVAILGNGGTSKTMLYACENEKAKKIFISARTFRDDFPKYPNVEFVDLNDTLSFANVQIILNATPVGMFPKIDEAPLDLSNFPHCEAVFDTIYNPEKTLLLKQADSLGIKNASGLQMLHFQAQQSAKLFKSSQ